MATKMIARPKAPAKRATVEECSKGTSRDPLSDYGPMDSSATGYGQRQN